MVATAFISKFDHDTEKKTKISRLHFLQHTEEELREYLRLPDQLSKAERRIAARIVRQLKHALPRPKKREVDDEPETYSKG